MRIYNISDINFGRRLKPEEKAEYSRVLTQGRNKCIGQNFDGNKFILIVPASSLPNRTGVGNLNSKESQEFFDFAKLYWGINETQILPIGQYHGHRGEYPIYSGTSMDLGNHVIDIHKYTSEKDFEEIVQKNTTKDRVNFSNVVEKNSAQENVLRRIYKSGKYEKEFEEFKKNNIQRLKPKAIYNALTEIYHIRNYKYWNKLDENLFNRNIVGEREFEKRVKEIQNLKGEEMDFYYFKQFLAEDSLKNARENLNKKGIKLNGDMLCGFSYDEVWANPKAFIPKTSIGWDLPALNLDSEEGQKLLREKVRFYAERFDGIRIDASWTYVNQPNIGIADESKKFYQERILNLIDEEVKKVKGESYDLRNIMHEFAASREDFDIYDGYNLKPYVKDRVKIYTSDHINENWGTNKSFLERGWSNDSFVIGARNHDSKRISPTDKQIDTLSKVLKIPAEKLQNQNEFVKAKLAEPMSAKYSMIYFADALNINQDFQRNSDKKLNYATQIPLDYQDKYFSAIENGEGFNPMDALEKSFKAKGLDKTEPKLYKKIVKYRKILEQKDKKNFPILKTITGIAFLGLAIYGFCRIHKAKPKKIRG